VTPTAKRRPKQAVRIDREADQKGCWTPAPGDVLFGSRAAHLTTLARLTYIAVRYFCRARTSCWPDDVTVAEYLGVPEAQVGPALAELEAAALLRVHVSKSGKSRKLFLLPIPRAFTEAFLELSRKQLDDAMSTHTRARREPDSPFPSTAKEVDGKEVDATVPGAKPRAQRPSTVNAVDVQDVDVGPSAASEASDGPLHGADGNGDHGRETSRHQRRKPNFGLSAEQMLRAMSGYGNDMVMHAFEVIAADPHPEGTAKLWFARDEGRELSPEALREEIAGRARLNGVLDPNQRAAREAQVPAGASVPDRQPTDG
jgi:hypothetical protein